MAIAISCGKCGKRYSVKDELAGKKIRCKECETLIAIPLPSDDDDLFGGVELKSTGRSIDEDEEEDDDEESRPVRRSKAKKKSSARRNWRPSDGMPVGVILAITAIAILMVLNSLALVFASNPLQIGGPIVRLLIEARVMWGLSQRMSQTRVAATIMAVLMTLVLAALWFMLSHEQIQGRNAMKPDEVFILGVLFGIQICCELVVIVGLNLPTSQQYLSE